MALARAWMAPCKGFLYFGSHRQVDPCRILTRRPEKSAGEAVMDQSVYAVATMDTKGHELAFVAERLRAAGVAVVTVDVGTKEPPVVPADIDRSTVAGCHPPKNGTRTPLSQI